jgi:ferredoxin
VNACHEGAIGMVDGKAKLLRDDYCDGLGNCLPACPTDAISFEERDAAEYNEAAVKENQAKKQETKLPCGCPGTKSKMIHHEEEADHCCTESTENFSRLSQWPVQIKLVPVNAPYFENANLLVAADCTAYAYGDFHNQFIKNRITLIGCPKLDDEDYSEKLTAIIKNNNIKSVTIVRMEVPCCGGLEHAVKTALQNSGKFIPWQVVTISTDGKILE